MERDLKLQNEIKIQTPHINIEDYEFTQIKETVINLFGNEIDFSANKDWTISFSIKNTDAGLRNFSGTLKMTDNRISGEQMQIFSNPVSKFQSNMQNMVNKSSDIESISIVSQQFGEKVIAKRKEKIS